MYACTHVVNVFHLPPVDVILVDYLEDVSCLKPQARLLAGNQVVIGWIVVIVTLEKHLRKRHTHTHTHRPSCHLVCFCVTHDVCDHVGRLCVWC